jgi:hypothetical protein
MDLLCKSSDSIGSNRSSPGSKPFRKAPGELSGDLEGTHRRYRRRVSTVDRFSILFLVFGPIYISEPAFRHKPDIMNYCAFEPDEEKRGCVFRPHPHKILD